MINMLEPVSSGASKAEKKKRKKRKTSTRWIPVGDHPVYRFIWKGGTSGTKHEKPLAFLVTRGERNGKGDALPAVWIPGKQRQDEKKKEKNVSFDNAAISLPPFDLCSPPSNSPRRLFPFFPFSRQLASFPKASFVETYQFSQFSWKKRRIEGSRRNVVGRRTRNNREKDRRCGGRNGIPMEGA